MAKRPLLRQGYGGQAWWRWLASASFIGYFLFLHLSLYYERQDFGVSGAVGPGGVFAGTVLPGGAADRLGVEAGDRFISMNGLRLNGPNDCPVAIANEPIGVAAEWLLERDGRHGLGGTAHCRRVRWRRIQTARRPIPDRSTDMRLIAPHGDERLG